MAKKHAAAKSPQKSRAPAFRPDRPVRQRYPEIADKHDDVATASILENVIDAAEKLNWFLFEASRRG